MKASSFYIFCSLHTHTSCISLCAYICMFVHICFGTRPRLEHCCCLHSLAFLFLFFCCLIWPEQSFLPPVLPCLTPIHFIWMCWVLRYSGAMVEVTGKSVVYCKFNYGKGKEVCTLNWLKRHWDLNILCLNYKLFTSI